MLLVVVADPDHVPCWSKGEEGGRPPILDPSRERRGEERGREREREKERERERERRREREREEPGQLGERPRAERESTD